MGSTTRELCSDARDEVNASGDAREHGEANGLSGRARNSPEMAPGVVSHDRAFIDNITTRTIEVTMGGIYDYKVNYSHYLELRKERREQQQKAYDEQQKMIAETTEFIDRFKGTYSKTLQVGSRAKMLQKAAK